MSFKIKTILFFLLISLFPYIITMFFLGKSFQDEQLKNLTHEMQMQLSMTVDRIDRHLNVLQKDMTFIAKSENMVDIISNDYDLRISRMLEKKTEELKMIGDFFVVNNKNIVIASSDFNAIGKQLKSTILFEKPIFSPIDGKPIGMLITNYSLKNLNIFFPNSKHRRYFLNTDDSERFKSDSESTIKVSQSLESFPRTTLVLEEDKSYAYRLVEKYEKWFVATLVMGIIFISFMAIFFANYLLKPLLVLSSTAQKVTQTQDYSTQVDIVRGDEIGQLSSAFNSMILGMNHALGKIKLLNHEIEDTQKEVVFTMGAIGESRSKETGNHVKRVAEYSYLLARSYGLSHNEAELLKQASPMHDIGKVAIPDAILNKPGRLTPEEFDIMKNHAKLGYEMLKSSSRPLLNTAAIIAYEHHEKYDGSGYPRGLKENEIHIYGRITAVADVFDALGSDRVYKKAWEDDKIFALFKSETGKHFDPQLIEIFFNRLDDFLKIRSRLKDV